MTDTTKTGGIAEMRELSLDEIDATAGGNWLGDIFRAIKRVFDGPGDLRRPTDRPGQQGVPPQ